MADVKHRCESTEKDLETKTKKLVSIISPVYNEGAVISEFITRILNVINTIREYDFEVVLVDDGSSDNSLNIMKEYAYRNTMIRIIELTRNYGQTSALSAGIDNARGDIIITMDSDLQHFPEEIPLFIKKIEEGFDIVCGWRKERMENIIRRWPSRIANLLLKRISKIDIHDFGTTYRAYRKSILERIELFGEMHRFIPALASRLGYRIAELPIKNIPRPSGRSNYSIMRTYGVTLDLFFLNFYLNYFTKPLRIFGLPSLLFLGIGFSTSLIMTILSYAGIIQPLKEHIALLLFSILLMTIGISMLFFGLLAEVLNRIYYSVRRENIYNIRKIYPESD
ncbi:MAG: glycosyltransferase family 2 protein [Candidatus Nitrosotenuis sp.]